MLSASYSFEVYFANKISCADNAVSSRARVRGTLSIRFSPLRGPRCTTRAAIGDDLGAYSAIGSYPENVASTFPRQTTK